MRCRSLVGFVLCFSLFTPSAMAQNYAQAGALQSPSGNWDIGVTFSSEVDTNSVVDSSHYTLSVGAILGLQFVPQDGAVVLTANGVTVNQQYTLHLTNIMSTNQTVLPPADISFKASDMSWAEIGANELGFPPAAVAIGNTGFDLISGGIQFYDTYDESTFAYEKITGDFDKQVRVAFQDSTSVYGKAGLMARESLDAGKPRPADPSSLAQAFSRYVMVDANPVTTAEGGDANNLYEVLVRSFPGGIGSADEPTVSLIIDETQNAPPAYPNAWLRLKRQGQTFSFFRSTDGLSWVLLTTFTFPTQDANGNPAQPFPNTVYVGINYTPENGNIGFQSGLRNAFMGQFREYGNGTGVDGRPKLSIEKKGNQVQISWDGGVLQSTPSLATPDWKDVPGAKSPYLTTPAGKMFFRARL
jgi:hypothetical protein